MGNSNIGKKNFSLVEQDERFEGAPSEDRFQHSASVEFMQQNSTIIVKGQIYSGSRNCKKTSLQSVSLGGDEEKLTIEINDERIEDKGCTTSVEIIPYRTEVTLESAVPERVRVEHRKSGDLVFEEEFNV